VSSGFFLGTPASFGWVAASMRISVILSRFCSILLKPFSGLGLFGGVVRRFMSLGGFFIQVSVSVFSPYGVFVYALMATIVRGGVSMMVAGFEISLPKSGEPAWSSTMYTWVIPAL